MDSSISGNPFQADDDKGVTVGPTFDEDRWRRCGASDLEIDALREIFDASGPEEQDAEAQRVASVADAKLTENLVALFGPRPVVAVSEPVATGEPSWPVTGTATTGQPPAQPEAPQTPSTTTETPPADGGIFHDAEAEAERVLHDAGILHDAEDEAKRVLHDAEAEAERLLAEAEAEIHTLEGNPPAGPVVEPIQSPPLAPSS